mmetsp:Transcript_5612/g.8268  ORF Transcript_5612/g.8268 Transcript_5612/m.8268 type:complete len:348 (-) Transcript_5612:95-1138(-)
MPSRVTLFDDSTKSFSFVDESLPTASSSLRQKSLRQLTSYQREEIFSSDLTSSNRLLGYVLADINCLICAVSAVLFLQRGGVYRLTVTIPWKIYAAITFGFLGAFIFFFIILCHFDTRFFPQIWWRMFKKGSVIERNIILLLMLYWIVGLWVCTSAGSVGTAQANVFFSSWIVLGAIAWVFMSWRDDAECFSIIKWARKGYPFKRYLILLAITSTFGLLFWIDVILCNSVSSYCDFKSIDTPENLIRNGINWVLGLNAASLGTSVVIVLLNETCFRQKFQNTWKYTQGIILLSAVVLWSYVVLSIQAKYEEFLYYPSNFYFLTWGSFLFAMSAFASWLHDYLWMENL